MDIRAMEDLLVCLFDPLLSTGEKVEQLQLHCVDSICTFDEAGVEAIHGVEVVFSAGSVFQLIIIPTGGR